MIELKPATDEATRRVKDGRFNLSAVYDTNDASGQDTELDFSFMDPPHTNGELGYIAHYRCLKMLGVGGMGVVIEAEDTHLKRTVALKVMKREFVANYSSRERFLLEARAAASLESDHIVTVYQVGMAKDVPYLAMQLLHGESLDDRLVREAPLPMPDAMLIARQVAEGLISAHEHGLVHRDIKPANIWLESDERTKQFKRVKLLDFGLARMLMTNQKLTNVGMIVGTPQYMSPEQASGTPVDCRSDLFSLGSVLYVMLTGRLPFEGSTAPAMLIEIVSKEPKRPSQINRLIPKDVDDLIMKLMSKSPDDRPSSAQEVANVLDQILVEYSFLMPTRSSNVFGFPTREPSGDPKLNQTMIARSSNPTKQINAMPIFVPVATPAPVRTPAPKTPVVEANPNPFADLEIDLAALPGSPYEASKTRAKLPLVIASAPTPRPGRRSLVIGCTVLFALLIMLTIFLIR